MSKRYKFPTENWCRMNSFYICLASIPEGKLSLSGPKGQGASGPGPLWKDMGALVLFFREVTAQRMQEEAEGVWS